MHSICFANPCLPTLPSMTATQELVVPRSIPITSFPAEKWEADDLAVEWEEGRG